MGAQGWFIGIVAFLAVLAGCKGVEKAPSEGGDDKAAVERALSDLVQACTKGPADAAKLVAYRGPDKSRRYKDVADTSNEMERRLVEGVCDRVGKMSGAYEVTGYETESESEGTWHILKVKGANDEMAFAFLKVKDAFALGDID